MIQRILQFIVLCLINTVVLSQNNITAIEYYFDTEPGIGNGTALSVTSGNTINKTYSLDISSLSSGYHFMYIRAKNQDNTWGLYDKKVFYISEIFTSTNTTIVEVEYFIDTDPGVGNGTGITLPATTNNEYSFTITTPSLTDGEHLLYIRIKNSANSWSLYDVVSFNTDSSLSISSTALDASFSIYPNPVTNFIEIKTNYQLTSYKVIDVTGKIVLESNFTSNLIHTSTLISGVYFVIVRSNKGTVVKRIIKE